jgi:DNA-binding NtrC family response regulator
MPDTTEIKAQRPETILAVDDDVLVRMVIAAYLRDCGFRVIEAANADEAIAVLTSDTEVGIVFSDVEMPGPMDGFGLNRWVRANRPDLPVILTGTPARASEAAADLCRHGPDLAKPYEPQLVLDRIRRLLADRGRTSAAAGAGSRIRNAGSRAAL